MGILIGAIDSHSPLSPFFPSSQFISCSVYGVFSSLFCDCGPQFTVLDSNGEEPVESFIGSVTKVRRTQPGDTCVRWPGLHVYIHSTCMLHTISIHVHDMVLSNDRRALG